MNNELKAVSNWIRINRLTINRNKSTALLMSPKLNESAPELNLMINNSKLEIKRLLNT